MKEMMDYEREERMDGGEDVIPSLHQVCFLLHWVAKFPGRRLGREVDSVCRDWEGFTSLVQSASASLQGLSPYSHIRVS